MNLKLIGRKISAILLAAAITFGVLPSVLGNNVVMADGDYKVDLRIRTYDENGNLLDPLDVGGTVTDCPSTVNIGDTFTLTIKSNDGYVLSDVGFGNDGEGYQSGKSCTFTVPSYFIPTADNALLIEVTFYKDYAYPLWVGGEQVTTENIYNLPGVTGEGASARFSPYGNTLTLRKVTGFNDYYNNAVIYYEGTAGEPLHIDLYDDNSFTGIDTSMDCIVTKNCGVEFAGTGSLTIDKPKCAIKSDGDISVNADIDITSVDCCLSSEADISVYSSPSTRLTAKSVNSSALIAKDDINIYGGTVKAYCLNDNSDSYPLNAGTGIDITDTHKITRVCFTTDPTTTTEEECIINSSGPCYVYSENAGQAVRGVIIEQTTFKIYLHIYTSDSDGNVSVSDAGGSATLSATTGSKGDTITVTVTPAEGYEAYSVQWMSGADFYNITDSKEHQIGEYDATVSVYFKPLPPPTTYSVSLNTYTWDKDGKEIAEVGGTATIDKTSGITGDKVTVTATPNEGYQLKSVLWGNGAVSTDITTSKEFAIEDFDPIVEVIFEQVDSGTSSGSATTYNVILNVATWDKDGNAISEVGGTASVSKTSGVTGDKITVTATPNEGYELDSIIYGDGGSNNNITTAKEFVIEDFDPVVDVVFKEVDSSSSSGSSGSTSGATMDPSAPTYTVIKGADSTVDGTSDFVVEVQRSIDDEHCLSYFDWVAIDGIKLTEEQAPTSSGSTIVTIKAEYLKTLSEGKHTIVVNFVDNSVSTTFTLQPAAQKSGSNIPSTGELQSHAMYIGIALIAAACGVTGIVILQKDKKRKSVR